MVYNSNAFHKSVCLTFDPPSAPPPPHSEYQKEIMIKESGTDTPARTASLGVLTADTSFVPWLDGEV